MTQLTTLPLYQNPKSWRETSILQAFAGQLSLPLTSCSALLLTFSDVNGHNTYPIRNRNILDLIFMTGLTHVRKFIESNFPGCNHLPVSCRLIPPFHSSVSSPTIHKKGTLLDPAKYRPINHTPIASRIIKGLSKQQFTTNLTDHKLVNMISYKRNASLRVSPIA